MPIFAFGCTSESCDHEWEDVLVKTTDAPPDKCPKCGAKAPDNAPEKLLTTATSRFRASDGVGGWAMNDQGSLQRTISGKNSTRYGD